MNFIEYPDREMMMIDLANLLAGEISGVLRHEDSASFVVPGGTTPGPIFDVLCAVDLDWGRVSVMLSDERWVPETSERSNTRLLKERLLVERAAQANLLPLYAAADAPEEKIDELEQAISPALPITPPITAPPFPSSDWRKRGMKASLTIAVFPKAADGMMSACRAYKAAASMPCKSQAIPCPPSCAQEIASSSRQTNLCAKATPIWG